MLCKLIRAELMKLRRSPVWLAFIVMPVIPALMGTFNYLENLELLHSEWYSLWTQHTLFTDYIFLPLLIGIYCSYTMYIEQKNHNWNRVLTAPVPKGTVFAAKLVCVGFLILLSELWIAVLYVVSGKLVGLSAAVPLGELTVWCLFGTLGGIALSSNLTNYRIEQLEKKVEKHNNLITRTYKLEQEFAVMDERVRVANHRIEDLEKEEMQHES